MDPSETKKAIKKTSVVCVVFKVIKTIRPNFPKKGEEQTNLGL